MTELEAKALFNARVVADAALMISQHLLMRLALEKDDPSEWLKESFESLNSHLDEKTAAGENAKWAEVRTVVSEIVQKLEAAINAPE